MAYVRKAGLGSCAHFQRLQQVMSEALMTLAREPAHKVTGPVETWTAKTEVRNLNVRDDSIEVVVLNLHFGAKFGKEGRQAGGQKVSESAVRAAKQFPPF
jgi:hypothetical protein